jgi:hypothetical protein
MAKNTSQMFVAAADPDNKRILDGIRAPQDEFHIHFFVAQRSKQVAELLLQLATSGEGDVAVDFLAGDAKRFDTLTNKGQLDTLMKVIEALEPAQQLKILKATENELYGSPNATVLQNIISDRDPARGSALTKRLADVVLKFDDQQRIQLLAAPMAVWWMSSYDKVPLLCEMVEPLSTQQRERILNSSKDVGRALSMACDEGINQLFKDCKRTVGRHKGMGVPNYGV